MFVLSTVHKTYRLVIEWLIPKRFHYITRTENDKIIQQGNHRLLNMFERKFKSKNSLGLKEDLEREDPVTFLSKYHFDTSNTLIASITLY